MGFDLYSRETGTYFRLTMWGMAEYRELLDEAGVLDTTYRHPSLPEETPGLSAETPDWPNDAPFSDEELAALGFRSPEPGKVPAIKLTTNDFWLVTSEECGAIGEACEAAERTPDDPMDDDYWEVLAKFGQFCRLSEREGGFWVL